MTRNGVGIRPRLELDVLLVRIGLCGALLPFVRFVKFVGTSLASPPSSSACFIAMQRSLSSPWVGSSGLALRGVGTFAIDGSMDSDIYEMLTILYVMSWCPVGSVTIVPNLGLDVFHVPLCVSFPS